MTKKEFAFIRTYARSCSEHLAYTHELSNRSPDNQVCRAAYLKARGRAEALNQLSRSLNLQYTGLDDLQDALRRY